MNRFFFVTIVFFLLHPALRAQLCTGSLGDPTVTITFGDKDAPPRPLSPGTTSYTLATNGCPNQGEYGFRGLLFNCFNNTWQTTSGDHTSGDNDGKYLLVNAGGHSGTLFSQRVDGLCPNTTYQMGVWIANLLKKTSCGGNGLDPNVILQVESLTGVVLAKYETGAISENDFLEWKEYATVFKTSLTTTAVVIKLINNARSGDCGNVIAIDDITFKPCGPSVSAVFTKNDSTVFNLCDGDTTTVILKGAFSEGFSNPMMQWQQSIDGITWSDLPGQNSLSLEVKPKKVGYYFYRFGVAESSNAVLINCRVYSPLLNYTVNPKPFAQITNYIFGCYGDPVAIFASGGSNYQWTGPNGFHSTLEKPIIDSAKFTDEGRYFVKITTYQGCSDTTSVNLAIYPAEHATIGKDTSICEGSSVTLNAAGGIRYFWYPENFVNNDSIPNPVASPKDSTRFMAVAFNQYGCTDTVYQTVNVWKKPVANAGPDKRTRVGLPVTLEGSAKGTDIRYFWTPSLYINDPNSLSPVVNAPRSMFYKFNVISGKGCNTATDDIFVKVYDKIIIPNAFSPNGDGINDTWNIEPLDLFNDADLQVFNRYGQIVFRNIGYIKPWDGTRNGAPMPVGTYYYILDLKIKNEKPLTGNVTILR